VDPRSDHGGDERRIDEGSANESLIGLRISAFFFTSALSLSSRDSRNRRDRDRDGERDREKEPEREKRKSSRERREKSPRERTGTGREVREVVREVREVAGPPRERCPELQCKSLSLLFRSHCRFCFVDCVANRLFDCCVVVYVGHDLQSKHV